MSGSDGETWLTIGDLVGRTGVSEGTLRMWERRHGFPPPSASRAGTGATSNPMPSSSARSCASGGPGSRWRPPSAVPVSPPPTPALDLRRPAPAPARAPADVIRKPLLLALSRAIEDESCARAERALLFGAFQRERFYRQSEHRWRELRPHGRAGGRVRRLRRPRRPARGPIELPIDTAAPLNREWAIVCEAPGHAVCMAGVELPTASRRRDQAREFEVIWSVEPDVVHTASEICLGLARKADAGLVERLGERSAPAAPPPEDQLRLAAAITSRTLGALG